MIQLFKDIVSQLMMIASNVNDSNIKESIVQFILTVLTGFVLCGVCFLCIYWGVDIVGNVASYAVRGLMI